MTEVTVNRGAYVPEDKFAVGNIVELISGDDSGYVVLVTSWGCESFFGGTIVVPGRAAHNVIGYTSDGFAKHCFKQFVGSITLKV